MIIITIEYYFYKVGIGSLIYKDFWFYNRIYYYLYTAAVVGCLHLIINEYKTLRRHEPAKG